MIIHKPKVKTEENKIRISSKIEVQSQSRITENIPKELWFEFPKEYKKFISENSDGFLVSVLFLAMALKEDIEVKGTISSQLLYSLGEYQQIFHAWFSKKYKIIKIQVEKSAPEKQDKNQKATCTAFSGGVDSFYTLWKHLPKNELNKEYQISHALFIHGFDISIEDKETYGETSESYELMLDKLNIKLLKVKTNSRDFVRKLKWENVHGATLIGPSLLLGKLIKNFYVPASDVHNYNVLFSWGSNMLSDPLLSTNTTKIIHDGAGTTRIEKIRIISRWPETYNNLRVCWENPNGLKNCSKCEECIIAMDILYMLNSLSKYSTFSKYSNNNKIRKFRFTEDNFRYIKLIIDLAKRTKNKDIAKKYNYALFRSKIALYINKIKGIFRWQ